MMKYLIAGIVFLLIMFSGCSDDCDDCETEYIKVPVKAVSIHAYSKNGIHIKQSASSQFYAFAILNTEPGGYCADTALLNRGICLFLLNKV